MTALGGTIEHVHTADPDVTDESCEGCKAMVEVANARHEQQKQERAQKHLDRLLAIATRFDQARRAAITPRTVTTYRTGTGNSDEVKIVEETPDPLILAAVIIADAIDDVEKRLDGIEDRLCEIQGLMGERSW